MRGISLSIVLGVGLLGTTTLLHAQQQAARPDTTAPAEPIADNSFLVEEAYNQEAGVVQHISTWQRAEDGSWGFGFTQEWPLFRQRHQLSATVPVLRLPTEAVGPAGGAAFTTALGDAQLHYRYQLLGDSAALRSTAGDRVALSPRLTLLLPTGDYRTGFSDGALGVQAALPLSVQLGGALVAHTNVIVGYTPGARSAAGFEANTRSLGLAQSLVWLVHPQFNVLVEAAWAREEAVVGDQQTAWGETAVLSPGVRYAFNFASGLQIVPGVAVPLGLGPDKGSNGVFAYLSFEHRFDGKE